MSEGINIHGNLVVDIDKDGKIILENINFILKLEQDTARAMAYVIIGMTGGFEGPSWSKSKPDSKSTSRSSSKSKSRVSR